LSVAVNLDDGGVDHGVFHVRFVRAGIEKPLEDIGFGPITVPLEHGISLAKGGRQVAPWTAGPHNPKHRLYEAAVVAPATPGVRWLAQAMRFHLRPLGVCQY
jgi:hypothetical protein